MEELIGILVLVVIFIIKVIDRKFSNASAKSAPRVDQREAFPTVVLEETEEEVKPVVYQRPEPKPEPKPESKPVSRPKPAPKSELKPVTKSRPKSKQPILEEETKKTREKIDPKKLVVYSEIMNRKY